MPRPTKYTQAKRKNIAAGRAAYLSKRQKLESDDSVPESSLGGPPSGSNVEGHNQAPETPNAEEMSGYAPPEQPESRNEQENQMIEVLINHEAAAPTFDAEEPREPEDAFSSQNGPEQPDYDEGQPDGEPPDATSEEDRHNDPLSEEHDAIQASIQAVATPFQNAPITHEAAHDALQKLELILQPSKARGSGFKVPKLDNMLTIRRLGAMAACLRYYCNAKLTWTLTYSSEVAAIGAGYGIRFGRNIRQFIRDFWTHIGMA